MVHVRLQANGAVRTETLMGRECRVIPAVMVRSQVLRNNLGATFLPADDITDDWANAWNGIPVLVGPHPSMRGQPVSGRSPELWNTRGAGFIFNARTEQHTPEVRRLLGEVWIDVGRADCVEDLQAVLDALAAGSPVELSTGFAAQVINQTGSFQGEDYDIVMHPLGADHLVISTEFTGACAVADGCGLGVNQRKESDMAGNEEPPVSGFRALMERASVLLIGKRSERETAWSENAARQVARVVETLNAVMPSDQERSNAVRDALQSKYGNTDKYVVLTDLYSDSGMAVFFFSTPFGCDPVGSEYYQCTFTEEGNAYTFGEPTRVRRMVVYEPVTPGATNVANSAGKRPCGCHQEADNMEQKDRDAIVSDVTNSLKASFTELLQPVLDRVAAVVTEAKTAAETAANAAVAGVTTALETLAGQVKGLVDAQNADVEAERAYLIGELSANNRTPYTKDELDGKPVAELRKIGLMAQVEVTSFAGRGGARTPVGNAAGDDGEAFIEPRSYFTKDDAAATATTGGK